MIENILNINPRKTATTLLISNIIICLLSTALWYFPRKYQIPVANLDELFYLDNEQNVPTYYSVLQLLLATFCIFLVVYTKKYSKDRFLPHWIGLCIGMFLLSADEFIMLHEKLKRFTFHIFPKDSFFYSSSWVTMAVILVAVVGVFYIHFFIKLPPRTRYLYLLSGVIFLIGALILERIGFSVLEIYDRKREFVLITMAEEFMEMSGITLFIYATLDYLKSMMTSFKILFNPKASSLLDGSKE